jgi:hypothetical protein
MAATPERRISGWIVLLVAVAIIGAIAWAILQGPRR